MSIDLSLNGQDIRCGKLSFDALAAKVSAKNNIISLTNSRVRMGREGVLSASGQLNLTGTPDINTRISIDNIPVESFLDSSKARYITMPLNGEIKLHLSGDSIASWMQSISGDIELSSEKARIRNVSLGNLLGGLEAIFLGKKTAAKLNPEGTFRASYAIENAIMRTREFVLKSGNMTIFGEGKMDLYNWTINNRFIPESEGDLDAIAIPVIVRGSLSSPTIMPQVATSKNAATAIGAVLGGPVGAGVGALVGGILSEKFEAPYIVPKEEEEVEEKPQNTPGLPFDLQDKKDLEQNLRNFLWEGLGGKQQ